MDENVAVIVDFHWLHDDDGNNIVKELSVMDVTRFAFRHWILKPPSYVCVTDPKQTQTNRWLTRYYHGISWYDGETPYEDLVNILAKHVCGYKYVFVKGLEKKQLIHKYIIHNCVKNLEDFDCPRITLLPKIHGTACLRHCDNNIMCTNHRVHALREWMMNEYRILLFLIN